MEGDGMSKMKSIVIVTTMLVVVSILMVGCSNKTVDSNNDPEMLTEQNQNSQEEGDSIDKTSNDDLDKETIDNPDMGNNEPSGDHNKEDKPENSATDKEGDSSNEIPEVILPMDSWED